MVFLVTTTQQPPVRSTTVRAAPASAYSVMLSSRPSSVLTENWNHHEDSTQQEQEQERQHQHQQEQEQGQGQEQQHQIQQEHQGRRFNCLTIPRKGRAVATNMYLPHELHVELKPLEVQDEHVGESRDACALQRVSLFIASRAQELVVAPQNLLISPDIRVGNTTRREVQRR